MERPGTGTLSKQWAHHRLDAWKIALDLVDATYGLTRVFPSHERFGLVSQMQRAAVSIPSNLAEGAGRGGSREFARYLRIARGSVCELETQYRISVRRGYVAENDAFVQLLYRVFALLNGLLKSVQTVV